jgi:hypothetical protein
MKKKFPKKNFHKENLDHLWKNSKKFLSKKFMFRALLGKSGFCPHIFFLLPPVFDGISIYLRARAYRINVKAIGGSLGPSVKKRGQKWPFLLSSADTRIFLISGISYLDPVMDGIKIFPRARAFKYIYKAVGGPKGQKSKMAKKG